MRDEGQAEMPRSLCGACDEKRSADREEKPGFGYSLFWWHLSAKLLQDREEDSLSFRLSP